ncbi:hypothetical protein V491_06163 [Pseudogymnoascus sp. VKM F-3775]|nr:hypothetical protein V491_06163 [Pseudogymnoascus sp. VKM F-3775]
METSELLLTILSGILIAYIVLNHRWKKPQPRDVSTVPTITPPTTESPISAASITEAAVPKKPFVVRVSGIPPGDGDASQVKSWVKATIAKLSNNESHCVSDIIVVPSCTDTNNLVALVDFKVLPDFLSSLKKVSRIVRKVPGRDGYYLDFDAKFDGFTQMYSTIKKPTADIVFMSGIGSHPYGSWTSKSDPWLMWPRHFLPKYLPTARVMVYGHGADIDGTSSGDLLDYSRNLSDALEQARKEFLVKDQQTSGSTLKATRGILFFAVPHRGMDVEDMITAIRYKNTSEERLGQISKDGSYSRQELDNFVDIIKNCKVASFYETALTRRLIMQSNGSFARSGELTSALDTRSAILDLPGDMETKHPVDADHSAIVKFETENCREFTQALDCFKKYLGTSRRPPDELDEATIECLKKLQVTDPELDMARIEHSKDALLKDCYEWILQDRLLQKWRDGDTYPLLCINGDPGKGKTMLMIALVRELSMNLPGNSPTMTFFFCQSTDIRLNNAIAILRGLIWKLAMNQPRLARIFHQKYNSDKSLLDGPNAVFALFSTLTLMLNECPGTTILIDALDECDSGLGRNQLLDLITKDASSSSKSKWLLSSRNNQDIKQLLKAESQMLSLELNDEHIFQAVNAFILQKTNELAAKKGYSQDLTDSVKKELMAKSNSTFLWVALACKSLLNVTSRKTLSTLQKLPPGLEPLYQRMMEEISQVNDEEDRKFCLQILRSMCLVFRPLSVEELITTAKLPIEFLNDDSLSELVALCSSFVTIRQRNIYFIHQSAKDYLVASRAQNLFSRGIHEEHGLFIGRSLDVMSKTLHRDMCNLKHPGSQARMAIIDDRLKSISYTCCFWVDHLVKCFDGNPVDNLFYKECLADGGIVQHFLLKHLLHWFEALSLFGECNRGILAILSLESLISVIHLHNILGNPD